jgi:hypothetical protein
MWRFEKTPALIALPGARLYDLCTSHGSGKPW